MVKALISSIPLIDERECKQIADRVRSLRPDFIKRGGGAFHTLGASTYNDDPHIYPDIARRENPTIAENFADILEKVAAKIEDIYGEQVMFRTDVGLIGFHIFDMRCNGRAGHIHVDEPYDRVNWGKDVEVEESFTFTLPVELPDEAGINFHTEIDAEWFEKYDAGEDIAPPAEPLYVKYELGHLYWHSGHTPHQIANPCDMREDQLRITLQGHGVKLSNGSTVLYF